MDRNKKVVPAPRSRRPVKNGINKEKIGNDNNLETKEAKNIIVVDTNVLIQDPDCIKFFLRGGNLVVIPWQVLLELDGLKRSREVGLEAGLAISNIYSFIAKDNANVVIETNTNFADKKKLKDSIPDHIIIATAFFVVKKLADPKSNYFSYQKVKLVTNDYGMRIAAKVFGNHTLFSCEPYQRDITKLKEAEFTLFNYITAQENLKTNEQGVYIELSTKDKKRVPFGIPVMIKMGAGKDLAPYGIALRRQDNLEILDPNISLAGIKAKNNGSINWEQIAAFHALFDTRVPSVFLQGGSGSGKTLLALAAAIHQRGLKRYQQILVIRPTVYLSDDDNQGYVPGDIERKLSPWFLAIRHNLAVINKPKKNAKVNPTIKTEVILSDNGIEIQPLGNLRGASFENCFMIVEEAQNLTRKQIKAIITRAGKGTKVVFTGDLNQIDNQSLTRESSGLAYAISRFRNQPIIVIINFAQTLRSELASLADKIL